jgi:hypothetical protein
MTIPIPVDGQRLTANTRYSAATNARTNKPRSVSIPTVTATSSSSTPAGTAPAIRSWSLAIPARSLLIRPFARTRPPVSITHTS